LLDDVPAARQFGFAMPQILTHQGFQMIDVVEINVVQVLHFRVDVARDCDVDEEQRAMATGGHHAINLCGVEDDLR